MTRFNTDVATLPIVFMNFLNSINHLKYYQFMKSNTINLSYITANTAITTRDNLSKEITRNWGIIRSENLIDKSEKRNYDMKALLSLIEKLSKERIKMKLYTQLINMGFTNINELPSNSLYPIIFELSEKNEMFVQLGLIRTIDPKIKAKKGKKGISKTEELTFNFIKSKREKLQLEINDLKKKIADYNENAKLCITEKTAEVLAA